ncbi:MAG: DegT/DnrJ/EryC1/StrS family aminotransferase, partial [Sedimentisphaerales bacterium]|nr:DegT/DnrJ/EryC1/StrS family aminotransferase [Sedimentisphaerales bacterium]
RALGRLQANQGKGEPMEQRNNGLTRRQFVGAMTTGSLAAVPLCGIPACGNAIPKTGILAVKGGQPVRTKTWPSWPIWDKNNDEELVLKVLRSGVWSRDTVVKEFESRYAQAIGAKRCIGTTNGTNALLASLYSLDVGIGDEVLVTPYTFVATIQAIFLSGALPIMVDPDPETFQINPDKMEEKIGEDTKAILPVHILGLPAHMDKINAIAKKHGLAVLEDACQAWLAEWKGKKCGTLGDLGCFSFQNSKNLPCGEGGAIVGHDDRLMDRCCSYHDFGRDYGSVGQVEGTGFRILGNKCRMAEYQAAILLAQMKRLEKQTQTRNENAEYLTSRIKEIPGIIPSRRYEGVTRAAYHLYPFRYKKEFFDNIPRSSFLAALRAEGVPCSSGYNRVNKNAFFENVLQSKNFRRAYPAKKLDRCRQLNSCPDGDRLCDEAVWLFQNLLLGTKNDMDDIADAIEKIYENRKTLA